MRLTAMIIATLSLAGCATMEEPDLAAWLEAQGYTDVRKGDAYNWTHGCNALQTATGFTATGPGGKRVEGVVCLASVFTGGRYVIVNGVT